MPHEFFKLTSKKPANLGGNDARLSSRSFGAWHMPIGKLRSEYFTCEKIQLSKSIEDNKQLLDCEDRILSNNLKMTKTVLFKTTEGNFKAELFTEKMPITCGNFLDLVERKFYDGLYIHRISPNYCIQFGCPHALNPHVYYGTLDEDAGQGSGPPDTTFKSCDEKEHTRDEYGNIEDELVKGISNLEGTLSMANSGEPETGGSQVFINVKDNKHLDWWNGESESAHPVFGKIIDGYDIVKKIEAVETTEEKPEQPLNPIKLISVEIL